MHIFVVKTHQSFSEQIAKISAHCYILVYIYDARYHAHPYIILTTTVLSDNYYGPMAVGHT